MRPNRRPVTFTDDDRAIEGLPIRLVIALVVGVAALTIMMNMLSGLGDIGQTEVYVEYDDTNDEIVETSDLNPTETVTIEVYSEDGEPVEDATILVSAGEAQLDETIRADTGANDHTADVTLDDADVDLRSDQNQGTLEVDVIPPSDSDYEDQKNNQAIVVIDA